jgi:glycosyltransferase involved in cell wall biosynthesis
MNIGFIGARGIPHGYCSTEQIALHVGTRLVKRGHSFTVYCRRHLFEDRSPEYRGVRRVFLPTIEHKIFGQVIHATLAGLHAIGQPFDIVHVQCLTNAVQALIPWMFGKRVICNVDGQEWENPKWPKRPREAYFGLAARAAMLISPEIITDAKGMFDIYIQRHRRPSTIIEYGAEIVEPRDPARVEALGLKPREYFFIAARLVPSNQIAILVDAFKKSGSRRILAIAGGGHNNSEYYLKMKENAGERVKFLGLISDQSLMDELYANAFAYLHGPYLGGVNSALLRPLGAGCPAIAYDSVFNREVLEMPDGGLCGILWKTEADIIAGIQTLEENPARAAELARLSVRQIRAYFSWDLVADQYELFYRGIVEKWPAARIREAVARRREEYAQAAYARPA